MEAWIQNPANAAMFSLIVFIFVIWSSIWKGIALWKAARNDSLAWFIALLVVNTLGILEIIYIFAIGNRKSSK